ncbi:MAG: metallophosphoesterase family protein [Hyphomicrobiales bacterium]
MATLAHLSDPHLAPLPRVRVSDLLNKRMLGYFNWHRKRKYVHIRGIAEAMVSDIAHQAPDHIAVTGDLVNISLRDEFPAARDWLATLGSAGDVSVVPGNHDAYVALPWQQSMGLWDAHMTSDAAGAAHIGHNERFPFVRLCGRMALIGLSSAVPTPPLAASGRLGGAQLNALAAVLSSLRADGSYRVVLIHHPPLPGQNSRRKALSDARELQAVLETHGAELVLHGHNHRDMAATLSTVDGTAHVIGVPSASAVASGHRPAAQYNLYTLETDAGTHRCQITTRGYDEAESGFTTLRETTISSGN